MVAALLLASGLALAAPVQCDPVAATALLAEARIPERRAPITQPELIPGLATASNRTEPALRAALEEWCSAEGSLSLARAEHWSGAGWSAHTFLLTSSEEVNCTLFQRTIAITVAVSPDTLPRYALRSRVPFTLTPVGDCPTRPTWREERLIDGEDCSVRLVLAVDMVAGEVDASQLLVRRASLSGWSEETLVEPAPPRLLDGRDGPLYELTDGFEDKWIVAHGDRHHDGEECTPRPGQTVWTWSEGGWRPHEGRDALLLLAQRGLWRLAGEEAWFLILAQADEEDVEVLAARARRMARKSPEPLYTLPSASFPGLNPGFQVLVPAPFPSEEEAKRAKRKERGWRRGYVKRAWTVEDPCDA